MRIALFVLVSSLICVAVVQWIYFSKKQKSVIKTRLKRVWWIAPVVFGLLFLFAVINAQFTLKLF